MPTNNPFALFVIQDERSFKREDGIEKQHFNLTQIPFNIKVDEHGFALKL